jgi:ACS family tartrate transporter-like MFS transporter
MIYFFQVTGLYGIGLWLPEILRRSSESISELNLGLISAVPFLMGTLSMVIWGWNSDRCKERKWHLVAANLLGGIGFVIAGLHPNYLAFSLGGMILASMGVHATFGPFWALKTTLLAPGLAAVGIALINSTGNLGGFTGPFLTGYLKERTGSLSWGLGLYGSTSLIAAFLTMYLPIKKIGK